MSTKTRVEYVDDMDPRTRLSDTDALGFRFAIDGVVYELDTTKTHADAIKAYLKPYVAASRRVAKLPSSGLYLIAGSKTQTRSAARTKEIKAIRQWANANGYRLSTRGRIPLKVIEDYRNRDKPTRANHPVSALPPRWQQPAQAIPSKI